MTQYEQVLGKSENKKLPINRKNPPAEPGSGRGRRSLGPVGSEWKE